MALPLAMIQNPHLEECGMHRNVLTCLVHSHMVPQDLLTRNRFHHMGRLEHWLDIMVPIKEGNHA